MPLSITNDFIFRYIFSQAANQDLLLDLVNTVLRDSGSTSITSLEVTNPLNLRSADWIKETSLDIKAQDEQGTWYDVEVQLWDQESYNERSLFYWAQLFANQLEKGKAYQALVPVIGIHFLGFKLFEASRHRHNCFKLRERQDPQIVLTDHLVLHFIEMAKEDHDQLQEWIRLFAILEEGRTMSQEDIVLIKSNPRYGRLQTAFQECLEDREARELALSREKYQRDLISAEYAAHRRGEAKGMQEGMQKGMQEGMQENARANARAMKDEGIELAVILRVTGLSAEEIQAL